MLQDDGRLRDEGAGDDDRLPEAGLRRGEEGLVQELHGRRGRLPHPVQGRPAGECPVKVGIGSVMVQRSVLV